MKKPVCISSLAMRFYVGDGWDRETVEKYADGEVIEFDSGKPWMYFIPAVNTHMDVERLYAEEVSHCRSYEEHGELRGLSDLEILRRRNW